MFLLRYELNFCLLQVNSMLQKITFINIWIHRVKSLKSESTKLSLLRSLSARYGAPLGCGGKLRMYLISSDGQSTRGNPTECELGIGPTCPHPRIWKKWSRYRPGVAQRVGRGIALLFHDRGTRRGWVVSRTPRPHFNPGKDPVPILQEAGWAPGPVWTGGKSRPHRDSIPDRPARSESLYWLSYPAHP